MPKRIFVSYSHSHQPWVKEALVPCLQAAGVDVVVDFLHMQVAQSVMGQMDSLQDGCDSSLLVLTPEYLVKPYCIHEMERAFARGAAIPVVRADCGDAMPAAARGILRADLRDDQIESQWNGLMDACGGHSGVSAVKWLRARRETLLCFEREESVNLVVSPGNPGWLPLVEGVAKEHRPPMPVIDLDDGAAASRRGLIGLIARGWGVPGAVPRASDDLRFLSDALTHAPRAVALVHFERAEHRNYETDFFAALRHGTGQRRLRLLVESRVPILELVPRDHPLSSMNMTTVELRGR